MRIKLVAFLALGVFMLGTFGTVSAAPAERYKNQGCETLQVTLEWCWSFQGMTKENKTPSGNVQFIANGKSSYSLTENGITIAGESEKFHYVYIGVKGQEQVLQDFTWSEETSGGTTCTMTLKFMAVMGEVHQDVTDFYCEDPAA